LDVCSLHRRAYNLAVESINNGRPTQDELRIQIREQVKQERSESGRIFIPTVCDEAVNLAFDTLRKCAKKWKKGEKAKLRFRSIKDGRQGFTVQRCAAGGQVFPQQLGNTFISEELNDEVKGQTVRVTWENGRWFVVYKQTLLTKNQGGDRLAAIDPGVRTFATVYGRDDVVKYGDGFQDELRLLHDKLDGLMSVRQRLLNLRSNAQWVGDRMRNLQKRIWHLNNKIKDITDDLHRRVAYDLVQKHDILLLPTFKTSAMSKKGEKRKIRKGTVRRMLTMSHYRFAQFLQWMCQKYGKTLIRVNESYTSKTDSRTGEIKQIGGSKTINGFDRDVNGARSIMLRALSKVACT